MPISVSFFVTPHAVDRYRERVHPGISYERALSEIIEASETAHFVKHYIDGEWHDAEYWRCSRSFGRLRLIVSRRGGELPQIRTILPGC
jgi:hypothetical protein